MRGSWSFDSFDWPGFYNLTKILEEWLSLSCFPVFVAPSISLPPFSLKFTWIPPCFGSPDTMAEAEKFEQLPQYTHNDTTKIEKLEAELSRDDALLAALGYKAELKREFKPLEVFGLAFSIIGLLPSIASTLVYSMPAGGPVGMVAP